MKRSRKPKNNTKRKKSDKKKVNKKKQDNLDGWSLFGSSSTKEAEPVDSTYQKLLVFLEQPLEKIPFEDIDRLYLSKYYLEFVITSYDIESNSKSADFNNQITNTSPLQPNKIYFINPPKNVYHPLYFLKLDIDNKTNQKQLIVCIKGTSNKDDAYADVSHFDSQSLKGLINPQYHNAIFNAAYNLLFKKNTQYFGEEGNFTTNVLQKFMTENPESQVLFVGHSLGAAVASYMLLILKLLNKIEFSSNKTFFIPNKNTSIKSSNIHAYLYGCPSVFPLKYNKLLDGFLTSIVNDDDAVCRLPPLKNLIVPGNDIIHIVEKNYECFSIKWFDLKNDSILKIDAKDHSLNSYNNAIKAVQNKMRKKSKDNIIVLTVTN